MKHLEYPLLIQFGFSADLKRPHSCNSWLNKYNNLNVWKNQCIRYSTISRMKHSQKLFVSAAAPPLRIGSSVYSHPQRCGSKFVSELILLIEILNPSREIGDKWVPQKPIDDKSTLVQLMVWYRQEIRHYLNQCWSRWPTLYGVNRP